MNKGTLSKLHTIIGKLEALQHVPEISELNSSDLSEAKDRLLRVLRKLEDA